MRGKQLFGVILVPVSRIIPAHAGQTRLPCFFRFRFRIIPAHAGQTRLVWFHPGVFADHPRACGANRLLDEGARASDGSSPRMRGKLLLCHLVGLRIRIIPAHAGQTRSSPFLSLSFADHPRACGANGTVNGVNQRQHGSSPRMRGKRRRHGRISGRPRIIPAHAGQTRGGGLSFISVPDHPRACGANAMLRYRCSFRCGSSPRMRGKHP